MASTTARFPARRMRRSSSRATVRSRLGSGSGSAEGYGALSRRSATARSAAVTLPAQHELLGQRGPRRRRGIGAHRHRLGDARVTITVRPSLRTVTVSPSSRGTRRPEARLDPGLLEVVASRSSASFSKRRIVTSAPTTPSASGTPSMRSPTRIGWPCGQVVASPTARAHTPRTGRHRVLEVLGLLVHVVPRDPDDVGEEPFDQPVSADDRLGVVAPGPVKSIERSSSRGHVAVPLEPAEHLVDGRGGELHGRGRRSPGHGAAPPRSASRSSGGTPPRLRSRGLGPREDRSERLCSIVADMSLPLKPPG